MSETIVAIATPPGRGAVCIVRLSGKGAVSIANQMLSVDLTRVDSHKACFTRLFDEDELIDEVLVIPFLGSRSFTGEPVVEIQGHGSPLVARKIIQVALKKGARLAEPGEFSLRAFQNGKIDLAQAEAIQGMIAARSERALKAQTEQLRGALSEKVGAFQKEIVRASAILEAWVDFPEEGLEFQSFEEMKQELQETVTQIEKLERSFIGGKVIEEGLSICLVGAPNVGKSSLLNQLVGKERSIVTNIPGTTRDYIEEGFELGGFFIRLIDTAGLRTSGDLVEKEGMRRALEKVEEADVVLALFDATAGVEREILEQIPLEKRLLIWNKIDLGVEGVSNEESGFGAVFLSAKSGEGIEALEKRLIEIASISESGENDLIITHSRHAEALKESAHFLRGALEGLEKKVSAEFVALDVRHALEALSSIIGQNVGEEILDALFSQFCLGK